MSLASPIVEISGAPTVDLRPIRQSMRGKVDEQIIRIPYSPRKEFKAYHNRKQRFAVTVAHRRCGKTVAEVNEDIKKVLKNPRQFPPPQVAFISPTFSQGKRNAWLYAKYYASKIPGVKPSEAELSLNFPNGGKLLFAGSDNYDSLRGMYLDHASLDEYATQDPRVWTQVVRPALSDYAGSATFIGSAKGRNHFYDILKENENDPDNWLITILKASETGILSEEELRLARQTMSAEEYEQEYECNFDAAVAGTFFGEEVNQAEKQGRIRSVPYDPAANVYAAMDLGIGGASAVWLYQLVGNFVHLIGCYQDTGQKLDVYANWMKKQPFAIETLYLPHDGDTRELQTGKSRKQFFEDLHFKVFTMPKTNEAESISNARIAFAKMYLDKYACAEGIDCLRMYRRIFDHKKKVFSDHPLKDWSSHLAEGYKYVVQSMSFITTTSWGTPLKRNIKGVV